MGHAMTELQFTSNEGDDSWFIPHVELQERSKPLAFGDDLQFPLPAALCGLEELTLHESLGVLRFLAFRLARVLYIVTDDGLAWYQSYYEDTTVDDYLEVAAALLAALRIEVVSTSKTGEITVDFSPIVEDLEQFFLDEFVPIAHYLRVANPDGDEDFEYDFDDAFIGGDALKKIYSLVNFYKTKRIIDLDSLLQLDQQETGEEVVAVRINGISTLQPKRELTQPMDRVLLSIIGVLQFLGYSSEYGELYAGFNDYEDPTLEQLEKDRDEYIEEFPDEEEVAHEKFNDRAHGEVKNLDLIIESAAFHTLGITSITETEDGSFRATLVVLTDLFDCLRNLGYCEENDYGHLSPFVFDEPVGPVSLGWYEYFFFTPDDDEEDSDG